MTKQNNTIETLPLKDKLRLYWEDETCGTRYGSSHQRQKFFEQIENKRYEFEPYIIDFADFTSAKGKKVLEIGVGAGTDFYKWVKNDAIATGIDLTESAVKLTRERLEVENIRDFSETPTPAVAAAIPKVADLIIKELSLTLR